MTDDSTPNPDQDPEHHPDTFPCKEAAVIFAAMILSAIFTVTIAVAVVGKSNLVRRTTIEPIPPKRLDRLAVPEVKTFPTPAPAANDNQNELDEETPQPENAL